MANPIIQRLNQPQQTSNNPTLNALGMMGKDPNKVYEEMMQTNPQFREFVESTKGLTPIQIIQKYGGNPNMLNMLR